MQKERKVGTQRRKQRKSRQEREAKRKRWASHHLAGEVMTQHIHLSGRCLLLLLYRGHKLTQGESIAPALLFDITTMSQAAGTKIKKRY